jgi:4-amino-4-deoxy-L-arabinose transferase-like glycosyltransferase
MRDGWTKARAVELALVLALTAAGAAVRMRLVDHGFVFAGSDSYGYLNLADELRLHHRYALGPREPLHYGRMPLYAGFLALVKGDAQARVDGGSGWARITHAQIALDLLALPLVYLMTRRLGGRAAAAAALALAALTPLSLLYTSAVLTESLATVLTIATLAPLILGAGRPRLWFPLAGVGAALSTLLRPDGVFLLVPIAVAVLGLAAPRRQRAIVGACALAAWTLVYAPWPVRNLARFGHAYPVGARVDRFTRPLPHYQGFWAWLWSWSEDSGPQTLPSTLYLNPPSVISVANFPASAFDDAGERATVAALFGERARHGLTAEVDDGFARLAQARAARHPLRVHLVLPTLRAYHMWISPYDELLQHPLIWPLLRRLGWSLVILRALLVVAAAVGLVGLWRAPSTRVAAVALGSWMAIRTAVLSYTLYSMARYTTQVIPIAFVVAAAGAAAWRRRPGAA